MKSWPFLLMAAMFLQALPADATATADADSLLRAGIAAYREGRFRDAVDHFEAVRAEGLVSGPLFYNLGTAYFEVDDVGRSMANFRRALDYLPRDRDLRANIEYVKSRSLDRAMVDNRFPLLRLLGDLAGRLTWHEWLLLTEAAYLALILLLGAAILRPAARGRLRAPLQTVGVLLVVLTLFFGRALHDQVVVHRGAVLPGEIAVRSGPGERFTEEFLLHPGTVVRLHREAQGWILVEVTPDLRGWLPASAIERI